MGTHPIFESDFDYLTEETMLRSAGAKTQRTVAAATAYHSQVEHLLPKKPLYRQLDPETRKPYDKFIRVDHAGERGADVIYNGQYDVLKDTEEGPLIKYYLSTCGSKRKS